MINKKLKIFELLFSVVHYKDKLLELLFNIH